MSCGFSPSDIVALVNLASKAYLGWKHACGEYSDLTGSLDSLLIILQRLESETCKPNSALQRTENGLQDLRDIVSNCAPTVRELHAIILRYKSLGSSREQNWDRLRFGVKNLGDIRAKLTQHLAAITAYLDAIGLGALSRIERDLNAIPERIQRTVDMLAEEIRAGRREGSTMTTYDNDEKDAWRQFRRELIGDGMRSSFVHKYKPRIKMYFRELAEKGELEERPLEVDIENQRYQANPTTVVQERGNDLRATISGLALNDGAHSESRSNSATRGSVKRGQETYANSKTEDEPESEKINEESSQSSTSEEPLEETPHHLCLSHASEDSPRLDANSTLDVPPLSNMLQTAASSIESHELPEVMPDAAAQTSAPGFPSQPQPYVEDYESNESVENERSSFDKIESESRRDEINGDGSSAQVKEARTIIYFPSTSMEGEDAERTPGLQDFCRTQCWAFLEAYKPTFNMAPHLDKPSPPSDVHAKNGSEEGFSTDDEKTKPPMRLLRNTPRTPKSSPKLRNFDLQMVKRTKLCTGNMLSIPNDNPRTYTKKVYDEQTNNLNFEYKYSGVLCVRLRTHTSALSEEEVKKTVTVQKR